MSVFQALKNKNIRAIMSQSWGISWPMAVVMFAIFLIGLTDVYVAGKFGKEVQAAYGLSYQLWYVFAIIAFALTVGGVSVVSMLYGGERQREYEQSLSTLMTASAVCGLTMSSLAVAGAPWLLSRLHIPLDVKARAVPLVMIYAAGIAAHYILINSNAVLRASGMVRKSMQTMVMVCVLNVGLNFYLSFHTGLGFYGIAVSTVISTVCGCMLNACWVRRLYPGRLSFSRRLLGRIVQISWPSGVLHIFWQLGAMVLYLIIGMLPEFRVEVMAAFTNGLKIESAIFLPAFAFNMSNAVVMGNLIGKKQDEDAFASGIMTAAMGSLMVTVLTAGVLIFCWRIAGFLSDNPMVVSECVRYICISLVFEPVMAWGIILSGGLNGVGDTRSVMKIITLSVWLVRVPVAYVGGILLGGGPVAIWWAMNLSIFAQTFFMTRHFYRRSWIARARVRSAA